MGCRSLSRRQMQCLDLVRQGMTSGEIGRILGLSSRTVDQYLAQSCARLQTRNRAQAVAEALRLDLIGLPSTRPGRAND